MARRLNLPWRQPECEPGPITLTGHRLYILPTRLGLGFLALLAGLLLGSINYGVSAGYLFTFILAGVGVTTLFHTQRNLLRLTLQARPVTPVFAGETACFRLAISNPEARPRGAIRFALASGEADEMDIPAGATVELSRSKVQPRRGFQRPGRLTLSSTWPLGLFRCWTVFALDWGVLVYPRPATDFLPLPAPAGDAPAARRRRDGDDEFAGLRDYRPGDSPRRIAWKSAARGLPPLTKAFAGVTGNEVRLDWDSTPGGDVEAKLSRLTRWVLEAEQAGLLFRLHLPGGDIPPGCGPAHRQQALAALARHGAS